MSPILKEIKEAFGKQKIWNDNFETGSKICSLHAFLPPDKWMYWYLFPEIFLVWDEISKDLFGWRESNWGTIYPCSICSEEQIIRVMSEHGLL